MNGPIAQMVALACHANAAVRGRRVQGFLEANSTCRHCDEVSFFEFRKSSGAEPLEVAVRPRRMNGSSTWAGTTWWACG